MFYRIDNQRAKKSIKMKFWIDHSRYYRTFAHHACLLTKCFYLELKAGCFFKPSVRLVTFFNKDRVKQEKQFPFPHTGLKNKLYIDFCVYREKVGFRTFTSFCFTSKRWCEQQHLKQKGCTFWSCRDVLPFFWAQLFLLTQTSFLVIWKRYL